MKRTVRGRASAAAPPTDTSASTSSTLPAPSLVDDGAPSPPPTVDERVGATRRTVVTSFVAVGAHLFWIFVGPVVMALLLISIAMRRTVDISATDIAFFLVAGAVLACRWIDQRSGQATTGTGQLATWADFRRYAIRLPPTAIGIWGGAKMMAGILG